MKISLDSEVCDKHNVTLEEMIYLIVISNNFSYERAEKSLINKGLISKGGLLQGPPWITHEGNDFLSTILLESDKNVPNEYKCRELAITLRQIFPKGMKDGSYSWRGNTKDIAEKLRKFFKLYGNEWSEEQIINATKRYVEHFNGDYTQMRLLTYFILKHDREKQELVSDLATWLENDGMENTADNNWLTNMV